MSQDKQLSQVNLEQVQIKRRLGQALNVKEFAVLAGFSYSSARMWFREDGFPVIRGMVFWQDFVLWRRIRMGMTPHSAIEPHPKPSPAGKSDESTRKHDSPDALPPRAARLLAAAG